MKPSSPEIATASFDGGPVAWGQAEVGKPIRDGNALAVDMSGGSGAPSRHRLAYFLGHRPIEQHLAEFPGGRLQALPIGFDTGAHEWFDIFAGDPREPRDWGHWTNRGMTANTQCLYCHTTGYEKGYDAERDEYRTKWAEADVGCEACHGGGARHVAARREGKVDPYRPVSGERLLDVCGTCHALRRELAPDFRPGDNLLDYFEPILLDGDEYFPDGQIRDEGYEWGGFVQSEMYAAGVTCGSCHDVHSTHLRAEGDALCLGCHEARLAEPTHTHHAAGSAGSACVACHMPETVYMARDPRRDHSFPIPDPQLTKAADVPSACDRCHGDRGADWAVEQIQSWVGSSSRLTKRRFRARMIREARDNNPDVVPDLLACVRDCERPIWQASAVRLLTRFAEEPGVTKTLVGAAGADERLVRAAATWALSETRRPDGDVRAALLRATRDDLRAVRLHGAWGLRAVPPGDLSSGDRDATDRAIQEWRGSMDMLAEHPETHHTLGVFHADRGDSAQAEIEYRIAIRLAPTSVAPRYNLATLQLMKGDLVAAEGELRRVLELAPNFAPAAYTLGMLYGETGRWPEAVASLERCVDLDAAYPSALHDLAHAYVKVGKGDAANAVLTKALEQPAMRTEALRALVSVNLELGDRPAARDWAKQAVGDDEKLAADPRVTELLAE